MIEQALGSTQAVPLPIGDEHHGLLALGDRLDAFELAEKTGGTRLVEDRREHQHDNHLRRLEQFLDMPQPQAGRGIDDDAIERLGRLGGGLAPVAADDRRRRAGGMVEPAETALLPIDVVQAGGEAGVGKGNDQIGRDRRFAAAPLVLVTRIETVTRGRRIRARTASGP